MKQNRLLPALLGLLICSDHAIASDLVYVPVNPSFGGNPGNAPGLLASASSTNKHVAKSSFGSSFLNQTPLEQFNQTLERTVTSQLASAASSRLIGSDGKLTPGTLTTANFTITIVDLGGGILRVTTTDKVTGATTTFTVQQ